MNTRYLLWAASPRRVASRAPLLRAKPLSLFASALLFVLLAHPAAFAETAEIAPSAPSPDSTSAPARSIRFGASLQGMVVGSFISEPPEDEKIIDNYKIPYGGFAGVGGGWGLTLSATWEEWVGLELALLSVSAAGEGKINVGPGAITHEVTTSSIHIPLVSPS